MPVLIISVTMVTIKLIEDEFSAKLLFLVLYLILGALLIICKTMSGTRERVALVFIYWAGLIVLGY